MQVIFESADPQATELQALAERRVRHALKQLAWLAPRARNHMSDSNGPGGGIDKRCQVELATKGAQTVVITSFARDWFTALQSALARATRALLQNWQRTLKLHAPRLRAPKLRAPKLRAPKLRAIANN